MTAPTASAGGSRAERSHRVVARTRVLTFALAIGLAIAPHPDGIKGQRLDALVAIERATKQLAPPPRRTKEEVAQADPDECRPRQCYAATLCNVYRTLSRHVDEYGITWISFYLLAFRSGYDITTVKRAVKDLCRLGWLVKLSRWQAHERLPLLGEPASNLYLVLLRPLRPEQAARMPAARAAALRAIKAEDNWQRGIEELGDLVDAEVGNDVQADATSPSSPAPASAPSATAPSMALAPWSPPAAAPPPPAATRLPVAKSHSAALTPPPEAAERIHAELAALEAAGDVGMWTAPGHVNRMFQIGLEATTKEGSSRPQNVATICAAIADVTKKVRNEIALVNPAPDRAWITSKLHSHINSADHVDEPQPVPAPLPKLPPRPRLPAPPPVRPPSDIAAVWQGLAPPADHVAPVRRSSPELVPDERAELAAKRGPDPPE